MGAPKSIEPSVLVRAAACGGTDAFDAASIVEKASSLASSPEQTQEKDPLPTNSVSRGYLSLTPGSESHDSFLVDWDGENDQSHPHNWETRRKWTAMALGPYLCMIAVPYFADMLQS